MTRILLNSLRSSLGIFMVLLAWNGWGQTTYNTPGANTYTVPGGVTCLTVQIWGAGGAGGSRTSTEDGGGGGGGGGYTYAIVPVTPGQVIDLFVGQGGQPVANNNNGGNGETSWFLTSGSYFATGGSGGSWGTATAPGSGGAGGTGTFNGGNGGNGRNNGNGTGGGGGSSAGTGSNGNNGTDGGASGGNGGAAPAGGASGGNGGPSSVPGPGVSGGFPGGGGGGSGESGLGGAGGNGQIIVTPNALNICANTCTSTWSNITDEYISNVTFNGTPFNSTQTTNYTNNTASCMNVVQGSTYSLSVTWQVSGNFTENVVAFIDWNGDGDFGDAGESQLIGSSTTAGTHSANISISVPCNAVTRSIRMRIILKFGAPAPTTGCESGTFGETEDYCISITAATPPVANAGPDQNIACASSATLNSTASTPAPANGFWTLISGSGSITNSTDPSSTVTGMSNGVNTFQWTEQGTCTNDADQVAITVSGLPDVPVSAGNDIFTCTQGLTLDGSDPAPFAGQWVVVSGPNSPTFTPDATAHDAQLSGLVNGTYVLEWRVDAGACGIISDQMTFTFGSLPAPNAGPDQTICPSGTILNANDFEGAIGTWSVFSGPAGSGFVNPTNPNTTIYGLVAGTYVLHWSVSGGGCPGGTFDAMTITVNACTTAVTHSASTNQTFTGCNYTYTDNGGPSGNYTNGIAQTWTTFCPDDPDAYATLTVSAANFLSGDYITIYDSPSPGAPIIASYWFNPAPGGGMVFNPPLGTTITSSTGCLYVQMNSTATNVTSGWTSTVGCSPTAGTQSQQFVNVNNCGGGGGFVLCGSGSIPTPAGAAINPPDLGGANSGCLGSQEGASNSWVYITAETAGYIAFNINPAGGQDFDYAIWGPYDGGYACPGSTLDDPIRCSWAANGGGGCPSNIGLGIVNTAGNAVSPADVAEGGFCAPATNEGWTYPILAEAGEVYVLLFQNYGYNSSSFDVTINTNPALIPPGGTYASLGCEPPTVLPIELISFVGEHKDRVNKLYWNTASEYMNDYFTIEKSSDGENWTVLTTVQGAGTTSDFNHYSTIDESPYVGLNYYRLSQTDYDGTKKKYKTIAISTELEIENMFSNVFPNPTNNSFYFNYGGKDFESIIEVNVYNSAGQLMISETFDNFNSTQSMQIETIDLTTGIYYVSITQNETREMKKISIIK